MPAPRNAECEAPAANHCASDPFASHTHPDLSLPRLLGSTGGPLLEMSVRAQIAIRGRRNVWRRGVHVGGSASRTPR